MSISYTVNVKNDKKVNKRTKKLKTIKRAKWQATKNCQENKKDKY